MKYGPQTDPPLWWFALAPILVVGLGIAAGYAIAAVCVLIR